VARRIARQLQPCADRRLEIVNTEKQPDATSELLAGDAHLVIAVSAGKEDAGLASTGSHDDPALWAAIVR